MNTFFVSDEFNDWLITLKDQVGKALIAKRIQSAEAGNFGDCEPVGDGISEMRIHYGPGYRAYFTRRGAVVYLLLQAATNRPRSVTSSVPGKWPAICPRSKP